MVEESSPEDPLPLAGWTVGVTAARRREELVALLERRGARVLEAPAIRIVPSGDDEELRAATQRCVDEPPDVVVATTGIGFRGWMEAAEGWGLADALRTRLQAAQLLVRGPKAKGAVRAAGLAEDWSPESESVEEVLAHLLAQGVRGRRVAVQLHGEPLPGVVEALSAAGAAVVELPVYRWVPADDLRPLRRLLDGVLDGAVDCLTFTSAPAVSSTLALSRERGQEQHLLAALRRRVLAACVGPVTAAALHAHDVPTVEPVRFRLGALVRTVVQELPRRAAVLRADDHVVELRGSAAVVDGTLVELPVRQAAVLRALAEQDGGVLSRAQLLSRAWGAGADVDAADEHAVEVAVARLRAALGPAGAVVQTVVKRGYRIACSPAVSAAVRTS